MSYGSRVYTLIRSSISYNPLSTTAYGPSGPHIIRSELHYLAGELSGPVGQSALEVNPRPS